MEFISESPKISPFAFDGDLKEGDRSQVIKGIKGTYIFRICPLRGGGAGSTPFSLKNDFFV